ncbi:hypothetical protein CVT25_006156, partial [Psilocybe cyanescens]
RTGPYPIDLPHDEEPSEEHLASINDDAPELEAEEPDPEKLSPAEYAIAVEKMRERSAAVTYRKAQIQRWFHYQYAKDHSVLKSKRFENPYAVLTQKLIGKERSKPHLKTPVNMWRKEQAQHNAIEQELLTIDPPVDPEHLVTTRDAIARRIFGELSVGEQRNWKKAAAEEHRAALEKYDADLGEPSKDLEDQQRSV